MPNIRFLVVDRDPAVGQLISKVVEGEGYGTVVQVPDVAQAVAELGQRQVDFVICDMAEVDGPETGFLKLVKLQRRFSHVPFLMTSEPRKGDSGRVQKVAAASVDGYLLKPYSAGLLKRALEDVFSRYPLL